MKGVLSDILWKSSRPKGTSTDLAIAIKCNTALVEPPNTITVAMAFSKACLVIICLGRISCIIRFLMAAPTFKVSVFLSWLSAGLDDEKGRLIPNASIADDIVLAVYIPPHAPGPGIEFFMMPS